MAATSPGGTPTRRPPARWTTSRKPGNVGSSVTTACPGATSDCTSSPRACWAPVVTSTSAAAVGTEWAVVSIVAIAARSSASPYGR